ncbi:Cyclin-like F-box [Sarocladium implicatum]|nr:Cyclin-like F-box [Sarocladium implicatum]
MAAIKGGLDQNDVVATTGHSVPDLVPVIKDLLRTRYCIPGSILLVENLQITPVSRSGRWRAVKLLLGDGELCIQALLGGGLHRFVETGRIAVGAYLRLEEFLIRFQDLEEDEDGKPQRLVYLAVEDAVTVGWNKSYQEAWRRRTREAEEELRTENDIDLEEANLEYVQDEANQAQQPQEQSRPQTEDSDTDDDPFEDFEELEPPKRLSKSETNPSSVTKAPYSVASKSQIVALPRDWHDPQTPLKLTTLRSIPLLPYAQNWTCNVLGIVASLSDVESSHLPPYRQRIARIADPSTSKRVHLTIFRDPENFTPQIGSAVLLVGVKNHRFDGGSLKKYASDTVPAQWWFENPRHLGWLDVEGVLNWWAEVQRSQDP